MLGDRLWLARFQQRDFKVASLDQELFGEFETLRAERRRTDEEISHWVGSLDEVALAAPFEFRAMVVPANFCFPLWFLVTHFFNHQTHHRGQLTTLLTQAGVEVGVTDLMWLPGRALPLPSSPGRPD